MTSSGGISAKPGLRRLRSWCSLRVHRRTHRPGPFRCRDMTSEGLAPFEWREEESCRRSTSLGSQPGGHRRTRADRDRPACRSGCRSGPGIHRRRSVPFSPPTLTSFRAQSTFWSSVQLPLRIGLRSGRAAMVMRNVRGAVRETLMQRSTCERYRSCPTTRHPRHPLRLLAASRPRRLLRVPTEVSRWVCRENPTTTSCGPS